jgi:hypothetical protein
LCEPKRGVDRKYEPFANTSSASRASGVQTPQNVSDHHRVAPRPLSISSVPSTKSVDLAPEPRNSNVRLETSASTKSFDDSVPLYVAA